MAALDFTVGNFATALKALLPRGRAWPRDSDTTQGALFTALAGTFARLSGSASRLLADAFPATTLFLLPEWESSLGLPDPCTGPVPTADARRGQVLAKFAHGGGQSVAYFIGYALRLGYVVTVEQFAPFRAGISRAGDPLNGQDWVFAWAVHAPLNQIHWFTAGNGAAGEPLAYWGNAVLECQLREIAPAHTVLSFKYS